MTDHNTQETRNRAVLVGLNADSLPREDNASETTLEELAALVETAGGESVASSSRTAIPRRPGPSSAKARSPRSPIWSTPRKPTWWSSTTSFPPPSSGC